VSVVKAVFKRNVTSFFNNPAGYVFIILFVVATAWLAFVSEAFWAINQANLNALTVWMPLILLLFIPAVTMSTWAEEKKLGTEELLFTIPCTDFQVVLGKFLANLAVFTAALAFILTHAGFLLYLGDPDLKLLFATYLGYWLMGAAYIATGMFASSLTNNITVGFILGALFCLIFAFAQNVALIFPGRLGLGINAFAAKTHMESFTRGIVAFKDIVYFASVILGMLYLNATILGKRRWPGGPVALGKNPWLHTTLRLVSVVLILVSINVLSSRFSGRIDVTEEKLSSLSEETINILDELSADKPVYIQAWISEDVPPAYAETRDNLLGTLKEYDVQGGDALRVKIYRPERFSQEARDAKEQFNIQPLPVMTQEDGEASTNEIFMGAAFICGLEEEVIPRFHGGIPVEYELTRTIRVVSKAERPKVGIIDNELKLFGDFNFQTYSRKPPWQIVEELRKQYDVESIKADSDIPEDVDVVVAALPSLCKENELDNLIESIKSGKPMLILMDPLPVSNIGLSPRLPRPSPQQNQFMMAGRQPQGEPKCDLNRLLDLLGVRCENDSIVWDAVNPHPQLRHLSPEFVFITDTGENAAPETEDTTETRSGFSQSDSVTSGLQELLSFFSGKLSVSPSMNENLVFEPLLRTTSANSGTVQWSQCVQQSFFGPQLIPLESLKRMPHLPTVRDYIVAARITGELPVDEEANEDEGDEDAEKPEEEVAEKSMKKEPEAVKINVILVADLDMISDQFFEIRKGRWISLDNVPFVLNCVDSLAGEDSYISLRKRRSKSRTLTTIENIVAKFERTKLEEENEAEGEAQLKLAKAQAECDRQIQEVESMTDLDVRSKQIKMLSVQKVQQQLLSAQKAKIEEEKNRKIEASRFAMEQAKRKIRVQKKAYAVIIPVILPMLIAVLLYFFRRTRENRGAAQTRLLRD